MFITKHYNTIKFRLKRPDCVLMNVAIIDCTFLIQFCTQMLQKQKGSFI